MFHFGLEIKVSMQSRNTTLVEMESSANAKVCVSRSANYAAKSQLLLFTHSLDQSYSRIGNISDGKGL